MRPSPGHLRLLVAAGMLLAALVGASMPASGASRSGTVVGAYVPSATNLSTTACAPGVAGRTDFGSMLPGSAVVTSSDCLITFGSSNDVGRLRIRQSDGTGAAMHQTSTGVPDSTFSGDGVAEAALPGVWVNPTSIAVQPDGKVVVGSSCSPGGGTGSDFCIARLSATGVLDTSFDGDGYATTAFGAGATSDDPEELLVQPDGRIVAAGTCQMGATDRDFCVARYLANGAPDTSFSGDGKATFTFASGAGADLLGGLAQLPDGRLMAGGYCQMGAPTNEDHCILRLTADGQLDTTFGEGGRATASIAPTASYDTARGIALLRSGTVVVGGHCSMGGATGNDGCYSAFTVAGTLDTTFGGGDGVMTNSFVPSTGNESAYSMTSSPLGGFAAVQFCNPSGHPTGRDICISRFDDVGAAVTAFSGDGMQMVDIAPGAYADYGSSILVQPDDKVVVAGYCDFAAPRYYDVCAARLLPDGSLDPSFATGGKFVLQYAPAMYDDYPEAVTLGADGAILVADNCGAATATPACVIKLGAGAGIPQYADGSADWDTPSVGHFAACLRAVTSATATWTANATCPTTDGAYWNPVPAAASQVAVASASTSTATAALRFGFRVPPSQSAGAYEAPITFEVLAP